ncbi:MAG: T9SS type A sorting domain-containing protein [Saprospiraceae bacterium]|nr:T9SS type A sorting domain-containing protein [Saprospiraceae bacterium]
MDCQLIAEPGLQNFIIKAAGVDTYYAQSDSLGDYEILLDTGNYELSIVPMNYWEPCNLSYPINAATLYDSTRLDLPMQGAINCPLMTVEISTPFLRQCNQGYYAVSYCNYGVVPAVGATVAITLDPEIHFSSATAPLLSQNGQVLLFDLGNVGTFDCDYFKIYFTIDCDLTLIGQTLCSDAHIYPDSICANNWAGPNLEVTGICQGDSVHFTITNTGGDMPQPQAYIVIEDNIILMTDDIQLLENQTFQFSVEAQEGATYHLLASQDPNMPAIFGYQYATAAVEGCSGTANPAAISQFPQDDGEPWLSIDCHEVVASFDPNDKSAMPTGWQDEHFIQASTELDYLIRFQNTGTDTAFRVVLIDTLSSFLDPTTIRLGASSHPYNFRLSGQGVAKFIFEDILLPDSNVNEALSHGFVQFHIAQQPDNQPGMVIENTAGIYFDYNAPVYTNTTFHTIHMPWMRMVNGSLETFKDKMSVKISPNPMGDWAMIELENLTPGENRLVLLDVNGKEVLQQPFTQNNTLVQRSGLVAGLYFFKVENTAGLLATGKLIVR